MNSMVITILVCLAIQLFNPVASKYHKCTIIKDIFCECEEKPSCSRNVVTIVKYCSLFDNTRNEDSNNYCSSTSQDEELVLDRMCNETWVICSYVKRNEAAFPQFSKNSLSKSFYLIAVNKKNYKKVPDRSFQGLQVERVNLRNNRIEVVERRAFYNMSGLRYLNLSINEIKEIELNYLFELEVVDLSGNRIAQVNNSMFMNLTRLKYLDLHYNSIEAIEKDAFRENTDLRVLDLSSNRLKSINFNLNLSSLVSFSLDENWIDKLPSGVFSNLNSLKILMMEKNELSEFSVNETFNLKQLKLLTLDNNVLGFVDLTGLTFFLTSLLTVSMSQNNFKSINFSNSTGGMCAKNNNLKVLDLNSNTIVEIDRFTFACFGTLTFLDLSNQIMSNLSSPDIFYGLKNLTRLNLNNNSIVRIYAKTFIFLVMLNYLDLSSNELENLDSEAFRGLDNLTNLILTDNNLKGISSNLFKKQARISTMELGQNKLTRIEPNCLAGLQNSLNTLQLFSNRLQFLKNYFFTGLRELTFLNLRDNQISSIEKETFNDLVKLDTLNLADNSIANIDPYIFIILSKLRVLDLSYNVLIELNPNSFRFLTRLKKLFLEHNQLVKVNFNKVFAQESIQLEQVNLEYNCINTLDMSWFTGMDNLTDLNMNNNDFNMKLVENSKNQVPLLPNLKHLKLRNSRSQLIRQFNLSNLLEIDLSYSQLDESTIQSIPFEKIQTLKLKKISGVSFHFSLWKNFTENLLHLDLSHNKINLNQMLTIMTMESSELQNLVLANISLNSTSFTYLDVSLFPNLTFFDASCNKISTVRNISFTELTLFNMSRNSLTRIYLSMFLLTHKLTVLDMSFNLIEIIEEASLLNVKKLAYFDISHNRLKILNQYMFVDNRLYRLGTILLNDNLFIKCEVFFDNPKIDFINLAANHLTEVPNVIINQVELVNGLDLSRNSLTVIRSSYFKTTNSMYSLFLNKNLIKMIEEFAFSNMKLLYLLDLSNNRLSNLSGNTFNGLFNLRLLNLSKNSLEIVQNGLLNQLYYLRKLDLIDNSIKIVEEGCFRQNKFLSDIFVDRNPFTQFFQNNTLTGLSSLQYLQISNRVELNYETLQIIKSTARRKFVKQVLGISYYDSIDIETLNINVAQAGFLHYTENQCFQIIFLCRNLVNLNLLDSAYLDKFVNDCMGFVAEAFVNNEIPRAFQI